MVLIKQIMELQVIPGEVDGTDNHNPPECTASYDEVATPVKVLFLVDKTGSNLDNANTSLLNDGTDPDKSWRVGSINNLKSNLSLNLFSFNITLFRGSHTNTMDANRYGGAGGDVTKSLINGFTNNVKTIDAAMSELKSDPDKGKTPYQAALAKARDIIKNDIKNDSVSKYSVIMVTDGYPDPNIVTKTNCGARACSSDNGADADIPASIEKARQFSEEIMNIDPKRVNVNTVYYYRAGQRSSTPVNILSNIANAGKGAFIEAASNQVIDFKNVVLVPDGSNCP